MADPFEIGQNDRRPLFVVVLKDNFGEVGETVVNLTTAGTAYFNMRAASGGAVKVSRGTATISNAAGGEITYNWGTADTNTAGDYEAEVEVLWNDGKPETFPGGQNGTDDASGYWPIRIKDDIA
jgi:hypothetical protein